MVKGQPQDAFITIFEDRVSLITEYRDSLIRIPTPPEPLAAFLDNLERLWPIHKYPGIVTTSLSFKKVSQITIISRLKLSKICLCKLLQLLSKKPLVYIP